MWLSKFKLPPFKSPIFLFFIAFLSLALIYSVVSCQNKVKDLSGKNSQLDNKIKTLDIELSKLKNEDQYKINEGLKKDIKNVESTYKESLGVYNRITDLRAQKINTGEFDKQFAKILDNLSKLNYSSASSDLKTLTSSVAKEEASLKAVQTPLATQTTQQLASLPVNNAPPSGGFSQQKVATEKGEFLVSVVAADLNSTRVLVDTASDGDCRDNCPALPLATYVSRNGAFAGINGSYFCPPDYPSCAGKVNSFDTLLMNKNKVYFNSENNVYSSVPLVYFSGSSMGVRGRSADWGRDTGVDSVIAMQTLLVSGGSPTGFVGGKGAKTFIGTKGSTVFIGIVYNATFNEAGTVLKTMGLENALNLDQGGSTALWYGGYKAGPGRNLPNAVVLVRK
jgi:exopolysaccharide biosynthesis protein